MKNLAAITTLIALSSFSTFANEKHKLGVGLNYHLDQESSPSYQFSYQWQFSESFEFETRYVDSGDIEIKQNELTLLGDYSQFSLGANFIKRYNESLSLKFGTGLGFITSSANETLIQKQSMAPYLMISANYQFNRNLAIEFGQFSHFNKDVIDTHHSIFLSLNYTFGDKYVRSLFSSQEASEPKQQQEQVIETLKQPPQPESPKKTHSTKEVVQNNDTKASSVTEHHWFVQFGAFNNRGNAEKSLVVLRASVENIPLSIINHKQYYRIVSKAFNSKQRAEDLATMLKSQHSLTGYVTQLKP